MTCLTWLWIYLNTERCDRLCFHLCLVYRDTICLCQMQILQINLPFNCDVTHSTGLYCTGLTLTHVILDCTGRIRIQCRAIVGPISGQYYYEFGVNGTRQSGLVWSRLWSKSASQIKTSDTLVVIQTKPTIARHWILILPVSATIFRGPKWRKRWEDRLEARQKNKNYVFRFVCASMGWI